MMSDTPTLEQMTAYQQAFDYFNEQLFGNHLPQVILNFSRSGSHTIAFYAPKRWQQDEKIVDQKALDEISLNPKYLGMSMEEIMSSLVHEMVHLWQFALGHPSRRSYHNREWAMKMKEVGLQPDDGTGKETGQNVSHRIMEGGLFQKAFQAMPESHSLPWRVFVEGDEERGGEGTGEAGKQPGEEPTAKPKSKSGKRLKYSCPSCDTNIWGKEGLRIGCIDCGEVFQAVS
jgi:predicted SprT family Zn-dependent metalloprotease